LLPVLKRKGKRKKKNGALIVVLQCLGCAWGTVQISRGMLKELRDITERSEALVRGSLARSHSTQGQLYTPGVPRSASCGQVAEADPALSYGPVFSGSIALSVDVFQASEKLREQRVDPILYHSHLEATQARLVAVHVPGNPGLVCAAAAAAAAPLCCSPFTLFSSLLFCSLFDPSLLVFCSLSLPSVCVVSASLTPLLPSLLLPSFSFFPFLFISFLFSFSFSSFFCAGSGRICGPPKAPPARH